MHVFCNVTMDRSTGFHTAMQQRMRDAEVARTLVASMRADMLHANIPLQTRLIALVTGDTSTVPVVNIVT